MEQNEANAAHRVLFVVSVFLPSNHHDLMGTCFFTILPNPIKPNTLADFPLQTFDKIRYADADRQGHVNNAVFATFLETGRVEILYNPDNPILVDGASFVIASLKLDFLQELRSPGQVAIGTGVIRIGNRSMVLFQRLFQQNVCVAEAKTVIVQVANSGGSAPLSPQAKETLARWLITP